MGCGVMSETLPTQIVRWHPQADLESLHKAALTMIRSAADIAIRERGKFLIVLAGGETPRAIYRQLCSLVTDWAAWHIFFSDERCLPVGNVTRNSQMAAEAWLNHVPIPLHQVHVIPVELGTRRAAAAYAVTLRTLGDFDLVLLGLGEDGHTASLFSALDAGIVGEDQDTLAVFDAPKPPSQRVSLTARRLGRTRRVLFMINGRDKLQAVAYWRTGKDIPARHITPATGVDVLVMASLLVGP